MFQHNPILTATLLGSGALPAATVASLTLGTSVPRGSLLVAIVQGAQTSSNALVTTVIGKGDEVSLGPAGPFSYDGSTAAYIRWVVFRTPSGYNSGQVIFFTTTSNWPSTTYLSLVLINGATQYLGYTTTTNAAGANIVFTPTYTIGTDTIISNAFRTNQLELVFNTNAAAVAWNGIGTPLSSPIPDAGVWTSFINGAGPGLGVINVWGAFTNRRPDQNTGINGRYPSAVNNHTTFIRFGGG